MNFIRKCFWLIYRILCEQIYLFDGKSMEVSVSLPKSKWNLTWISLMKNIEILMHLVIETLRKITYHFRMPNLWLMIGLWKQVWITWLWLLKHYCYCIHKRKKLSNYIIKINPRPDIFDRRIKTFLFLSWKINIACVYIGIYSH